MWISDEVLTAVIAAASSVTLLIFAFMAWLKWSPRRNERGAKGRDAGRTVPRSKSGRHNPDRKRRNRSRK